ncbi:hypothetical protein ACFLS9_02390 [Bacteroidota bacterium]
MSKRNSKNIFLVVYIFVLIVFASFVHLILVNEIKSLRRQKASLEIKSNERINLVETNIVEVQKLSSEDRIVKIATDELGLEKYSESYEVMYINLEEIKQIEKNILSKYE